MMIMKLKNTIRLSLILIIIIGCCLRLYRIGVQSIWLDEAYSVIHARQSSIMSLLSTVGNVENVPPFYFLLLNYWVKIFGSSEVALRCLSALLGILSIPLLYKIGVFLFNRRVAIVAALLLALSPFHIRYSQEGRPYAISVFIILLCTWFFLKLLKERSLINWFLYILFACLAIYTHYMSVFIIVAQTIYAVYLWRKDYSLLIKWFFCQALVVLLFLPWLIFLKLNMIQQVSGLYIDDTLGKYGAILPGAALTFIINTFYTYCVGFDLRRSDYIPSLILILIPCLFLIILIFWIINIKNRKHNSLFLILHTGLPIMLAFIVIFFAIRWMAPRYLIQSSIFYFLILAIGIEYQNKTWVKNVLLLAICLMWGFFIVNYYYNPTFQKEQWREASTFVTNNVSQEDVLFFHAYFVRHPFNYYFDKDTERYPLFPNKILTTLNEHSKNKNRIWMIFSHASAEQDSQKIESWLDENHYHKKLIRKFKGIDVVLYSKS